MLGGFQRRNSILSPTIRVARYFIVTSSCIWISDLWRCSTMYDRPCATAVVRGRVVLRPGRANDGAYFGALFAAVGIIGSLAPPPADVPE